MNEHREQTFAERGYEVFSLSSTKCSAVRHVAPAQADPFAVSDGWQKPQHRSELVGHEVVDDSVARDLLDDPFQTVELVGREVRGPLKIEPVEDIAETVRLRLVEFDHDVERFAVCGHAPMMAHRAARYKGKFPDVLTPLFAS